VNGKTVCTLVVADSFTTRSLLVSADVDVTRRVDRDSGGRTAQEIPAQSARPHRLTASISVSMSDPPDRRSRRDPPLMVCGLLIAPNGSTVCTGPSAVSSWPRSWAPTQCLPRNHPRTRRQNGHQDNGQHHRRTRQQHRPGWLGPNPWRFDATGSAGPSRAPPAAASTGCVKPEPSPRRPPRA
jgi:hypothetical protein